MSRYNKITLLITLLSAFFLLAFLPVEAQFSFARGKHVLDISGSLNTYANYRFYDSNTDEFPKNRIRLRDARIKFEGKFYPNFSYELEADFANTDRVTPGIILDAYLMYKAPLGIKASMGYQRVPFGRNSMVPIFYSAFTKRPAITDGTLYVRRDMGVLLKKTMSKQRFNIYLGAFNGLGTLGENNDESGNLEVISRVDFAFPARFRYREIDLHHVPIPMFAIGANVRYADKRSTEENDGIPWVFNGERWGYGADFAFQYQGFSLQAEVDLARLRPHEEKVDDYLFGLPTDFFRAGGYIIAANYYFKPIKSVVAVRFDEINPNDLVPDNTRQTFGIAYNYCVGGFQDIVWRIEYRHHLEEEASGKPWKPHEIRTAFQYRFR